MRWKWPPSPTATFPFSIQAPLAQGFPFLTERYRCCFHHLSEVGNSIALFAGNKILCNLVGLDVVDKKI